MNSISRCQPRLGRRVVAVTIAMVITAIPVAVRPSAVTWKNFRSYPAGQYRNVATSFRDGKQAAPPLTTTACAGALTPQQVSAMMDLSKAAGGSCATRLLTDQPATVVFETSCPRGVSTQVIRQTLRAIDARRVDSETRSTLDGQHEIVTRITSTYLGACPANMSRSARPVPKPSPSECNEIADMRRQTEAAASPCGEMPASYRAQCLVQIEAGRKMYAQLEQACR